MSTARYDAEDLDPSRLSRCSKEVAENPAKGFSGVVRRPIPGRSDEEGAINVLELSKGCPGCMPPTSGSCSCGGRIAFFPIEGDTRFEVRRLDRREQSKPKPKQQTARRIHGTTQSDAGPLFGGKS